MCVNIFRNPRNLSGFLEIISKHLNVAQIYINGTGYIVENNGTGELIKLMVSINKIESKDQQQIVNEKVKEVIGGDYRTIPEYLDTNRDKEAFKAIVTRITSGTMMANIANVHDKRTFQRSNNLVMLNLKLFDKMKKDLDVSEPNTLNDESKRRKKYRTLQKLKLQKLRHVFEGRRRQLKCEQFPELAVEVIPLDGVT